ncbi:MAG TPA: aldo/keto reductase [Ideonella sp.]|uniref:aldo/keto reductase n=1 Tax=Ideonella sp. TaxID=1929293 RepID=UPI002E335FED|nr:aldo/keto reductase [Ideonella sp.]HEX5687152.1 aldo/keto reductase [Ideonella sp.]
MHLKPLGASELLVSPICLGTMTFGEQVDEPRAHAILDHAVARGMNFIDTAEMYSVPPRAETYGATETILGRWFAARPGMRQQVVLATKVAGPSRGMPWVRGGAANLTPADIHAACDASLKRLQTDHIDLYQIHWPNRNAPSFGSIYFEPERDTEYTSIHDQLDAFAALVKAGKVRHIGLSNETPYGVAEFVRIAEAHGLPRVLTVQNPYCLISRSLDNGLDETMHRLGVALIPYSPLGFGLLTGKYDERGIHDPANTGRMALFERMKQQRWGRPAALAAARRYNALAREHGLTPTRMALAWCYTNWRVASTIIGVTTREQLDEDLDAWGTTLSPELLAAIDAIRWEMRDPAQ